MDKYISLDEDGNGHHGHVPNAAPRRCFAYGCPAYPTIYADGEYTCRWHYRRNGPVLQRITQQLRNNEKLIRWHDEIFSSSPVDFDMGEITKKAPYGMEPNQGEGYADYKARMRKLIQDKVYSVKENEHGAAK